VCVCGVCLVWAPAEAGKLKQAAADALGDSQRKDQELAQVTRDFSRRSYELEGRLTHLRGELRDKDDKLNEVQRMNISLEAEIQQYR
jgi:hypothetical protein